MLFSLDNVGHLVWILSDDILYQICAVTSIIVGTMPQVEFKGEFFLILYVPIIYIVNTARKETKKNELKLYL